jgi:signal transduction histidine kinase
MEERVAQMGGSLRIQSTPGGGTQLEVVTPAGTGHQKEARAM